MMRKTTSVLLLLLATLIALTGCKDDTDPKVHGSCNEDMECGSGICFDNQCYEKCASPGECSEGQFCVYQVNDVGAIALCLSEADFYGCESSLDCPELLGDPCKAVVCNPEKALCEISVSTASPFCAVKII